MKKLMAASAAMILAFVAVGCTTYTGGITGVKGSGNLTSETRKVSGYHAVSLSGVGELTINQNGNEGLTVEAEDNILPNLTSDVRNGTLYLGTKNNTSINPTKPIKYTLSVKNLDSIESSGAGTASAASIDTKDFGLELSGAGQANIDKLNASSINLTISGSGTATVAGKSDKQRIELSGAGSYKARDLDSKQATITVSGAGNATLRVSDSLDATVSGAGSVGYIGNPQVNQHTSGSGSVNKLGD